MNVMSFIFGFVSGAFSLIVIALIAVGLKKG